MSTVCRDCAKLFDSATQQLSCSACGSRRLFSHPELAEMTMAHVDCDAFFASVEKRDNPHLHGKPVIVGGGRRGVVAACCYVARIQGIRSAMPMFKALKQCPDAVVIKPRMDAYQKAGKEIRTLMLETTPLVEPISIDEAFLDLSGTEALHKGIAAQTLVRLVNRIEQEVGVTASIGLSYNKFLAKISSDLDKPRGFAAIGPREALEYLENQPVGILWGVGKALLKKLNKDGIRTVGHLRQYDEKALVLRYGMIGVQLSRFAKGEDARQVDSSSKSKSLSAETTFETDISELEDLLPVLWRLSEKVSDRLKKSGYAGGNVTIKLKQADFRQITRTHKLETPTQQAEDIYREALPLVEREADGRRYRLIGVGADNLVEPDPSSLLSDDLFDQGRGHRLKIEAAIDSVREKFGKESIGKGRGWRS